MHGLVCRSVEIFLRDSRGPALWLAVARRAGLPEAGVEAFLPVDPDVAGRLLLAAAQETRLPLPALLEDMGTHFVTHPRREPIRRLLRFGGADFADFLHSLQDLPARAALALPDLPLPAITVTEPAPDRFVIAIGPGLDGFAHVAAGMIRAMADDYGALVVLSAEAGAGGAAALTIDLADAGHAAGRAFALGGASPGSASIGSVSAGGAA